MFYKKSLNNRSPNIYHDSIDVIIAKTTYFPFICPCGIQRTNQTRKVQNQVQKLFICCSGTFKF